MTSQHGKVESEDDIPDLCKNVFFSKDKIYGLAWALAVIFVLGYGSAVVYALSNSIAVTKIQSESCENKKSIELLNSEINRKLDYLIKKP